MSTAEKISITLPPEIIALVREAVEAGEYSSSSEVVQEALRDWTQRRVPTQESQAEIRRAWQEAIENPAPGIPADEVMERLRRKYQAKADLAGSQK